MKLFTFAGRNTKEILRDPLTIGFSLGFPVVLLLLLTAIGANVPVDLFPIEEIAPGITVFGLSFMTLFSATLIARDRETALLQRLYTTPLRAVDFILGYLLPILPIAMGQAAVCYLVALLLGLPAGWNLLLAVVLILPLSLFYIGMGLLCGSVLNSKQVGGLCGALFTNLSAFLSGIWFDVRLVGGVFEEIAECLPFLHAVNAAQAVVNGEWTAFLPDFLWVMGYGVAALLLATFLFLRQMKRQ